MVQEQFGELFEVKPGEEFSKKWIFENDGEDPWPEDIKLIFVSGDVFGEKEKALSRNPIQPGKQADITLNFTAP